MQRQRNGGGAEGPATEPVKFKVPPRRRSRGGCLLVLDTLAPSACTPVLLCRRLLHIWRPHNCCRRGLERGPVRGARAGGPGVGPLGAARPRGPGAACLRPRPARGEEHRGLHVLLQPQGRRGERVPGEPRTSGEAQVAQSAAARRPSACRLFEEKSSTGAGQKPRLFLPGEQAETEGKRESSRRACPLTCSTYRSPPALL